MTATFTKAEEEGVVEIREIEEEEDKDNIRGREKQKNYTKKEKKDKL